MIMCTSCSNVYGGIYTVILLLLQECLQWRREGGREGPSVPRHPQRFSLSTFFFIATSSMYKK